MTPYVDYATCAVHMWALFPIEEVTKAFKRKLFEGPGIRVTAFVDGVEQ